MKPTNNSKTVVSIGVSCQTAHQLRRLALNQQNNAELASDLIMPSGLFDWLICPASSTINLLNNRIPDFTKESIQIHNNRAYWADYKVYFWHNFFVTDGQYRHISIDETFEKEITRWRYLRHRFSTLLPKNTIFVISNTQNNLTTSVFNESELDQIQFTSTLINKLKDSLASYFNTTTNNIHLEVITRPALSGKIDHSIPVTHFPIDHNEWKGSKHSWNQWWLQLNSMLDP